MMRYPSFQSVGTCSSFQIFLNRMWSTIAVTSMYDFSAAATILSDHAAFTLLACLTTTLISSTVVGVTTIGRSEGAASLSDEFNAADLLKSSSKCPTHLFLFLEFP